MRWALISFSGLAFLIYIYVSSNDEQVTPAVPEVAEEVTESNSVSADSVPFVSTSLATSKEDMNPSKVAGDKRFSESEIRSLEGEISDVIADYNESIIDGEPDANAIQKISELKEIYKQQALQSVRESNK